MILKWALVLAIGYFIYKRYIALPAGQDDSNSQLKNKDESRLKQEDDDYIDFEEVD